MIVMEHAKDCALCGVCNLNTTKHKVRAESYQPVNLDSLAYH